MATTKTIQATVKNRTDTVTNWTQKNPVLTEGEIVVVQMNTGETRLKIGDGTKTFTQLPYADEQIYNNVVTSVNGQTGDVTLTNESKSLGITGATSGQIAKITAVDETGKPTKWESADIPSGGASAQPDWQQSDSTAADYIKNKTGGYDASGAFDITWDGNIEGETVVIPGGGSPSSSFQVQYLWHCPELSQYSVEELNGVTVEYVTTKNDQIEKLELHLYGKAVRIDDSTELRMPVLYEGSSFNGDNSVLVIYYAPQDNIVLDQEITLPKKGYYFPAVITTLADGTKILDLYPSHIYQSSAPRMFDLKYMPYYAGDSIKIDETGAISANYKAGHGISIKNGIISVTTANYYSGSSAPANTLGADGDLYLQTEG